MIWLLHGEDGVKVNSQIFLQTQKLEWLYCIAGEKEEEAEKVFDVC